MACTAEDISFSFKYSTKHYLKPFDGQRSGLELQMNIKYNSKNECDATKCMEWNALEMIID